MNQPKPRGGKREGSGRKAQYADKSTITFAIEKQEKLILQQKFPKQLNKMYSEWVKGLMRE